MSRQTQTAKDHYKVALQQYKKRQYMETVKSIDKAISFGYRDIVVYDVKAAALSKLTGDDEVVWRDQAMDVIQHMCKTWGAKDWRPWHRRAEYLRSRRLYVHALTAIDKALELVDERNRELVSAKHASIIAEREAARLEQDKRLATASAAERKAIMDARRAEAKSTKDFTQLITPDVLLLITDHLLPDNPSIACRLSAVCRRWRDVLYERPAVWSSLVLGKTRPLQKATKFLERNKGRLLELKLLKSFDPHKADMANLLSEHVDQLRSFEFTHRPVYLIERLRGRFKSLEHLTQRMPEDGPLDISVSGAVRFDRGVMLDTDPPTLKSLHLENVRIGLGDGEQPISHLRSMVLRKCIVRYRVEPSASLYGAALLLERIDLDDCLWYPDPQGFELESHEDASPGDGSAGRRRRLDNLTHYSETSTLPGLRFGTISAPNLVHLEMSTLSATRMSVPNEHDILTQLKVEGLVDALPNLQSLDISGHSLVQAGQVQTFLEILSGMPSLRFLNVAFTFATGQDEFIKALTWRAARPGDVSEETSKDLLPRLEALSIAGLEITSIALRDFVLSRLPHTRQVPAPTRIQPLPARSAFKPSIGTARSDQQVMDINYQTRNVTQADRAQESSQSSTSSSSRIRRQACLKWLCLDHCQSIDTQLSVYLATKLPFVSHSLRDRKVIERIKGKGRYKWDLDYYHSCADETSEPCTVERVEGTTNEWRLVHHCGLEDAAYEPEPDVINIWDSQWDPVSSLTTAASTPSQVGSVEERGWSKKDKGAGAASNVGGLALSGSKRPIEGSTAPESAGQGVRSKLRKGKDRMKISIGPDGSLTGF